MNHFRLWGPKLSPKCVLICQAWSTSKRFARRRANQFDLSEATAA